MTTAALDNEINFSVVLIGLNEGKTMPRMLATCKDFLDAGGEVLFMDTGSTDGCVAITKDLGVTVHEVGARHVTILTKSKSRKINTTYVSPGEKPIATEGQRVFNFSSARNQAHTFAKHDMILQVDASDVFESFDWRALVQKIKSGVNRFTYMMYMETLSWSVSRFYDRRLQHWVGIIHEYTTALPTLTAEEQKQINTFTCDPKMLSLRHIKTVHKTRNYSSGMAMDLDRDPTNCRWLYYLGREFYYGAQWKSALRLLLKIGQSDKAWVPERNQALCYAAECCEQLKDYPQAILLYQKAYEVDPTRREPLLRLAALHLSQGQPQKTLGYAQMSLSILKPGHEYAEYQYNYTWVPGYFMYRALVGLQRLSEAKAWWLYTQQFKSTLTGSVLNNIKNDTTLLSEIVLTDAERVLLLPGLPALSRLSLNSSALAWPAQANPPSADSAETPTTDSAVSPASAPASVPSVTPAAVVNPVPSRVAEPVLSAVHISATEPVVTPVPARPAEPTVNGVEQAAVMSDMLPVVISTVAPVVPAVTAAGLLTPALLAPVSAEIVLTAPQAAPVA